MNYIPFNGDDYIHGEIENLVDRFGIRTVIETGTWSGHTARAFAEMMGQRSGDRDQRSAVRGQRSGARRVITIDNKTDHLTEEFGAGAVADLEAAGIEFVLGDSGVVLPEILARRQLEHPVLAYLDAHGGGSQPLMEELDALGAAPDCWDRCVIAIHDAKVPGKDFGFDGYGMEPICYELVQAKLPAIYPLGHAYYYNQKAAGACRGILYIYPVRHVVSC